jgi:REP element-mobilizing transposase RayT
MNLSLLIVTPQASFGAYIRQSLEEKYSSHIVVVDGVAAALEEFKSQNYTHAFLDTVLRSENVLDLGLALRQIDPGLHLVLISDDETTSRFDALCPWTLLPKPFYLPDLFRILDDEEAFGVSLPAAEESDIDEASFPELGGDLSWLQDVSKAAQHLTRLTLESSAQAALIIRGGEMWAYSGELSQVATSELVQTVSRDKKAGDLLKFIRLETTQAEHMLYATQLAKEINLAMVFDAETPFSTIRQQASHLAESLAFSPQEAPSQGKPSVAKKVKKDEEELEALFDFETGEGEDLPPISEILENIPNPNPVSAASEVKTSAPVSTPSGERQISLGEMPSPFARTRPSTPIKRPVSFTRESSPAVFLSDTSQSDVDIDETRPQVARRKNDVDLGATRVSKPAERPSTPIRINEIDLAATRVSKSQDASKPDDELSNAEKVKQMRPHSITEVAGRVLVEPSSRGMYDLTYACLLLPRFGKHHLAGDLAECLSEWMPNISIAFGWRLEYISVRPDYLQWVINVPPTTSPGYLMRIIRKQTSTKIFEDFPRLKDENPSGDFWAPGYLIMGGSQPHPSKLVKDYIKRTRERQGML